MKIVVCLYCVMFSFTTISMKMNNFGENTGIGGGHAKISAHKGGDSGDYRPRSPEEVGGGENGHY